MIANIEIQNHLTEGRGLEKREYQVDMKIQKRTGLHLTEGRGLEKREYQVDMKSERLSY